MAQRRMFSPQIVESDAFLDMALSTQALYFHLGMKADDDGFVNPRSTMRSIGASEDELKVLVAKRFVLPFDNGVIVIKHWKINNLIKPDRYHPTIYEEQKELLEVKSNGAYTERFQSGTHLEPEVRLGKVNKPAAIAAKVEVVKDEPAPKVSRAKYPNKHAVFALWGLYPRHWDLNTSQCKAAENLFAERGLEGIQKALAFIKENQDEKYFPEVSSPYDLDSKWPRLIKWRNKRDKNED